MKRTKKEISRLVRVTTSLSYQAVRVSSERGHWSPFERDFSCPLDYEAKHRNGERGVPHTFRVYDRGPIGGRPFQRLTEVVTKALLEHIDPEMEACSRVTNEEG